MEQAVHLIGQKQKDTDMNKPVEWGHLLLTLLALLLVIGGIVYNVGSRTENHEVRINQLEQDRNELKQDLKDIKKLQQETIILLQNKEDKK